MKLKETYIFLRQNMLYYCIWNECISKIFFLSRIFSDRVRYRLWRFFKNTSNSRSLKKVKYYFNFRLADFIKTTLRKFFLLKIMNMVIFISFSSEKLWGFLRIILNHVRLHEINWEGGYRLKEIINLLNLLNLIYLHMISWFYLYFENFMNSNKGHLFFGLI